MQEKNISLKRLENEFDSPLKDFIVLIKHSLSSEVDSTSDHTHTILDAVNTFAVDFDFKVVCDETNNTPAVIDANEFRADIFIKPARSINFITLTFVATRTGISFEETGV